MPLLTYTFGQFSPLTKIQSGVINQYFTDIKTLLNTTKLDSTNIQTNGIARSNLPSVGEQVSSSSGSYSLTSSLSLITNQSVTITTTGRPVIVLLQPDGSSGQVSAITAVSGPVEIQLLRGATIIADVNYGSGSTNPPSLIKFDSPAAGTYTYTAKGKYFGSSGTVAYVNMVVREL